MNDIRSRLTKCFTTVFADLKESEIPEASIDSVEAWDSLATVTLIAVIEEEFQVRVQPEELIQFVSFNQALDYLNRAATTSPEIR